jgi:hypothetical protein
VGIDDNDDPVDYVPGYAQYVTYNGDGTWTKAWIADSTDWDDYPSSQALENDVYLRSSNGLWPRRLGAPSSRRSLPVSRRSPGEDPSTSGAGTS